MNIKELVKLVNGKVRNIPKDYKQNIKSFKLDSREIHEGDTFICINNGYLYIEDAINNGAICIITDKNIRIKGSTCLIKVDDIKDTLLKIVSKIRDKYRYIPLIAITGSVGKTTTKELLTSILKTKYKVLKNEGNKNNYIGIAETMFKLNNEYDAVVLEVGMNHLGEIDEISKSIKPNISAITNIGTSHIGYLGNINNILKAKLEIVSGMNDDGKLVIPYLDKKLKHIKYKNINKCKDIKISNIKLKDKLSFKLKYHKEKYNINFNIPNKSYISNILVAFELSTYFVIHTEDIIKSINNFKSINSRMNIIDIGNYKVIDDTYNSSYESIKGDLNYLKNVKNKIIILGDIKELGDYSIKIHKKINKLLRYTKKDNILLVGEDTKYIKGIHFESNDEINNYLDKMNLDGYTILVKGSRLMHMEDIVNYLKK